MKALKIWNGRSSGYKYKNCQVYVAAYTLKQAVELVNMACYGHIDGLVTTYEIRNYFSKNCWGNAMDGITPTEPCVYMTNEYDKSSTPFRVI